jgi:nitrite reductase (cytochrome c-552)
MISRKHESTVISWFSGIVEKRAEAVFAYVPENDFPRFEPRNEVWGENFPGEYESYKRTADTSFRSWYPDPGK